MRILAFVFTQTRTLSFDIPDFAPSLFFLLNFNVFFFWNIAEPRESGTVFMNIMQQYIAASSRPGGNGALFFAVCRGKVIISRKMDKKNKLKREFARISFFAWMLGGIYCYFIFFLWKENLYFLYLCCKLEEEEEKKKSWRKLPLEKYFSSGKCFFFFFPSNCLFSPNRRFQKEWIFLMTQLAEFS